jgi:RNA polymerase sigma-70 factor, ECF subfamily
VERVSALDEARRARLGRMIARDYRLIWRLLRRLGVPAASVDDAAQQVFLIAAERLSDIRPESERAFAYGTALRVAQGHRGSRVRTFERLDDHAHDLAAQLPGPDAATEQQRAREQLDRVLAAMPVELRTVFVLFELEGLTSPEIAALEGTALGTVASRLRRARERFRELVKSTSRPGAARGRDDA